MKKRICAACLVLLIVHTSANLLLACGDKFLVSSRGTRYQKAPIKREPHTILIWANPTSELPKGLSGVPVDETLRKVGYRPTTVTTAAEFDSALNRGDWDVVIVGAADAQAVSNRLAEEFGNRVAGSRESYRQSDEAGEDDVQRRSQRSGEKRLVPDAVDEVLARRSKKSVGKA